MFKICLIFLTLLCACHTKRPYQVTLTHFEMSPESDPTWVDKGTIRVTKKSRNQFVISGTYSMFKNAGNDGSLNLVLYNVGFANNLIPIYSKQAKFCDYLKTENVFYPSLIKFSNLPPRDQCPFPKGNYTVTDFQIDEDKLPEIAPNGKFKGIAFYKLDNKLAFGYDFEFTVSAAN